MRKVKLGDICTIKSSTRIFEEEYVDEGIPFVRGLEISDGSLKETDRCFSCYIAHERYQEIKDTYGVPTRGDILITAVGTIGNLYLVDDNFSFYFKDGNIIWLTGYDERVFPEYLYCFFKSPYFKKQLEYALIGAVQKALTIIMLKEIEVLLPDRHTQEIIVRSLMLIDNKIALNKRMMAELEETAQLIYDYWFTQFDFPDENGNPYRSSGGKMVYNETLKREIPEGWDVGNLYDIADYVNGLACQNHRPESDDIGLPVIKIREMHEGINANTERVRSDIDKSHLIKRGDLLFAWSASLETMFWNGSDGGLNQHIFKVLPKAYYSKLYVYLQLVTYIQIFKKMAEARKTTMGHITSDHLNQSKVVLPTPDVLDNFGLSTMAIIKHRNVLASEMLELISLRDWLLPMLMNGQVTVDD